VINPDPIPFLESLGYTRREAAFLYAVGMHSGYFLRRQFDAFIGRVKGAISQHFLGKALRRGHIRALDFGQNRKVFHLHWKPIYRLLGDEDSQHRRVKGDLQIKARLMTLDYVLRDSQEHFLETEQAKVEFFTRNCGLSADLLPSGGNGNRYFPDQFPISTLRPPGQDLLQIRFAFIDEGLVSLRKFQRFVHQHEKLFRALGGFTVVYVSDCARHFRAAARWLGQSFPEPPNSLRQEDFPHGIEHFLEFLETYDVFHHTHLIPTRRELDVLDEGESIYTRAIHDQLLTEWVHEQITEEEIRERYAQAQIHPMFTELLLAFQYPVLEHRHRVGSTVLTMGLVLPRFAEPQSWRTQHDA